MKLLTTLITVLSLAAPTALAAPSLGVSPLKLTLTPRDKSATLTLSNSGDRAITLSVRIQRWTQAGGMDVLQATEAVIAAPATVTLRPGGRQVVRIAHLNLPSSGETAYRVLVTEMPTPDGPPLRTILQLSIPLFEGVMQGQPRLQAQRDGDQVTLRNTGDLHARLARLDYRDASGWHPLSGLTYLLAGESRAYAVPGAVELRYTDEDSPAPVVLPVR